MKLDRPTKRLHLLLLALDSEEEDAACDALDDLRDVLSEGFPQVRAAVAAFIKGDAVVGGIPDVDEVPVDPDTEPFLDDVGDDA